MTKVYRYRLAGPPMDEFARQAGVEPEVITKSDWVIDYEFDDSHKADVDAFLEVRGYEFVQEVIP